MWNGLFNIKELNYKIPGLSSCSRFLPSGKFPTINCPTFSKCGTLYLSCNKDLMFCCFIAFNIAKLFFFDLKGRRYRMEILHIYGELLADFINILNQQIFPAHQFPNNMIQLRSFNPFLFHAIAMADCNRIIF